MIGYFMGCGSSEFKACKVERQKPSTSDTVKEVVPDPRSPAATVQKHDGDDNKMLVSLGVAETQDRSEVSVNSPKRVEETTYPREWESLGPKGGPASDDEKSHVTDDVAFADTHVRSAKPEDGVSDRGNGREGYGGGMGGYGGGRGSGMGGYGGGRGTYGGGYYSSGEDKSYGFKWKGEAGVPVLSRKPIFGRRSRNRVRFDDRHVHWDGSSDGVVKELVNIEADEVWVIVKAKKPAPGINYETPGCGAMLAMRPGEKKEVPLPLKHTDVKGQISGYIAEVTVTQQFHNPYDEKIEAVYVFPLPQDAAINEFIMTIGERKIRGIIRERQEAERIYKEARRQGHVASLLTQERPNIFTQKVANIEPNKEIDVNIKYFNTLAYVDGWYEFVFPMVVGPRFNPAGSADGIGAVGRGKRGASGQKTEIQYLKPDERSGHDISLAVEIDAGVPIEKIVCNSHAIKNSKVNSHTRTVRLNPNDSIPNKDFVLRYQVAGKRVKSALVTHRDQRGGFFSLMLYPPENLKHLKRAPMEMIFVLDCSGSMSGVPIEKAKGALKRALRKLEPDDTFQVIRFSNNASQLSPKPMPATKKNIERGLAYVDQLHGSGGTKMIEGIKAALDFEHDPRRYRLVSFMTDGFIGNEADILGAVYEKLGSSRIFSFGIGSSVNRFLLDRMAKLGKGAVAYVGLEDNSAEIVDLFYDRISHPALTNVTIDWGGMEVSDVYPRRIHDLIAGRPVIVTGRFRGDGKNTIVVRGGLEDLSQELKIKVDLDDTSAQHPGIASVWARKQIEDMVNRSNYDRDSDLPGAIKQVALEYSLMSAYTAFVAVDSSRKTAGDHGVSVNVPVPVPEGVRYDTTVE
jgi:Ca-activated chloride channel family protein